MPVRHLSLTDGVVSAVSVPKDYDYVAVMVTSGTASVWITVDRRDPVAHADDTYYLPAGARRVISRPGQIAPSETRFLAVGGDVTLEVEYA
jgi:hypothetical protein